MTLYLIAAAVGTAVVVTALGLRRWSHRIDADIDQALALANSRKRHPVNGGRCHCGGKPHREAWHHGVRCYPLREYIDGGGEL